MKLEPIDIPHQNDEKTTEEQMKEQILDLQRMCNVLMVNQS
ncbi:hypothetical protein AAGG74_07745 [Bacillus mexicanus]